MYIKFIWKSRLNCLIDFAVISSYGMLSPVDGKAKAIYLVYGDEIGRRAGHPEYMPPTALTRIIHKDSVVRYYQSFSACRTVIFVVVYLTSNVFFIKSVLGHAMAFFNL